MATPKKDVWGQAVVYLVPACQCKIFFLEDIILSASLSNNLTANKISPSPKKDSNAEDTHLIKKASVFGKKNAWVEL